MEPKNVSDSFNDNAQDVTAPKAAETAPVAIELGALLKAAKDSKHDDARALIRAGVNVNEMNDVRDTALTLSLGNYDVRMARLLLQHGADVARYEDMTGRSLLAVLRHAGTTQRPEEETLACLLLDHGAAADARDNHGLPLVARYASMGMLSALERILEAGANPNAVNPANKLSPLYFAISGDSKCVPLVRALLAGGADPNGAEGESTHPLFVAVRQKNLPAAEALLKAGADPSRISTGNAMTPLLQALKTDNDTMTELLLTHGADIHTPLPDGLRAIDILVRDNANIAAVEKALAAGAKADTCRLDEHGAPVETALHLAVRHKRLEMINLMLQKDADPLCVDGFGYTPLQLAHSVLGSEDPIVDRLRLADGAARIERERAARAASVAAPPVPAPPTHRPPAP
ncbi:MAG: ankyrin repeat domain-containing protein [Alphaproteobacteria bacterium]|nr:ankyrin repeat domain-containing protein [Alphaproteobacteria bacterium]